MEYKERSYPLFSACGLNCGLCPRYQTNGQSKCPGCSGKGFLSKHPTCGVLSCSQRHEYEYCYQCAEYLCKKYDNADMSDSFITHRNQFRDLEIAKINFEKYKAILNEKVEILEGLLEEYDDGRRKSFYCIAINLLNLQDIKAVLEQLRIKSNPNESKKNKATLATGLFQSLADERGISLQLRKNKKT